MLWVYYDTSINFTPNFGPMTCLKNNFQAILGHGKEYSTIQYLGIPKDTWSMKARIFN